MRILHIVPTYFPAVRYGGPIYSVHALCRSLVDQGHEVHVYTTDVDGNGNSDVETLVPVEMDGVIIWYFPSLLLRRLYYSPKMLLYLKNNVRSYDILHLHSIYLWPTWAASRLAQRKKVPYLISPRGMLVKDLINRKNKWLKYLWLTFIERRNIENANALHVTSEAELNEVRQFNYKFPEVVNIPNGVDKPESYDKATTSEDIDEVLQSSPYVLYLGRLNWKKGLDRLIESWIGIQESCLVIAGNDEDEYLPVLKNISSSVGVENNIKFVPRRVDAGDKEALFKGACLFVFPSYSENFGNTVLEAMIRGVPVIVTSDVGASEVVKNAQAGIVVDGDSGSMVVAIKELLSDRRRASEMGQKGRAVAESDFCWQEIGRSMVTAYHSILKQAR